MASFLRHMRGGADDSCRRSNSVIESEGSFSRHSSIQGPYREGLTDTSFPVYCTVKSQSRVPRVYARSMLSLGHGLGVYNVAGNIARPKYHIAQGAFVGDVGYLNDLGTFCYCFNIFHPSDHPIQPGSLPQNFIPVTPTLSTEDVRKIPNHFSPGTILCSEGIRKVQPEDSLNAEFYTRAREGAVLVLPNGTTREELLNPSLIHAYVKEHAVSWYRFFNGNSDDTAETPIANGTLWVVTSVDRANSWATATFPSQDVYTRHSKTEAHFKYDAEDKESPWEGNSTTHPLEYGIGRASEGEVGAVLLGVMSVALSPSQWSRDVAYIPPRAVRSCPVLSVPAIGLQGQIQKIIDFLKGTIKPPTLDDPEGDFHPSVILLHVLLLSSPSATVGVIDDSIWIPHLNKRLLTHPEVVGLIQRVFDACDIVETDGLATLIPKKASDSPVGALPQEKKEGGLFRYQILSRYPKKKNITEPKSIVRQNMAKVLWLPE